MAFECILLVEDDSITNFLNTIVLEKLGIAKSIIATLNGEEALHYLRENGCPDLILLDINMPVMNGLEFLKAFHKKDLKNKEKTKIIILSSSENLDDKAEINSYNLPFMNKPLSGEKLLEIISNHYKE